MMEKNKVQRRGRERGQSLVEFALILPILLLLIFGLIEFGRVLSGMLTAHHCANELARHAVVIRSPVGVDHKDFVEAEVIKYAQETPICPTMDLGEGGEQGIGELIVIVTMGEGVGSRVEVKITYPVDIVVPILSNFVSSPEWGQGVYAARGRATMHLE